MDCFCDDTKGESFMHIRETLHVVAKEFRYHGVKLQGPCRALKKSGAHGKWTSNIQRDVLRTASTLQQDDVTRL